MAIKNNVIYTEGTVEQLGENVYFGTSNVQPSLWDNKRDYAVSGIITTLSGTANLSTGDYTLFFSISPTSQTQEALSEISRACIYAYSIEYEDYTSGSVTEKRTKINWQKAGMNPTGYIRLQYLFFKTGSGSTENGAARIINCNPMNFGGYNMRNYTYLNTINPTVSTNDEVDDAFRKALINPVQNYVTIYFNNGTYEFGENLSNLITDSATGSIRIEPSMGAEEVIFNLHYDHIWEIINCVPDIVFKNIHFNITGYTSAAYFNVKNSKVTFSNCRFETTLNNLETSIVRMYGNAYIEFDNCTFNISGNNKLNLTQIYEGINGLCVAYCSGNAQYPLYKVSQYSCAAYVKIQNDNTEYEYNKVCNYDDVVIAKENPSTN